MSNLDLCTSIISMLLLEVKCIKRNGGYMILLVSPL